MGAIGAGLMGRAEDFVVSLTLPVASTDALLSLARDTFSRLLFSNSCSLALDFARDDVHPDVPTAHACQAGINML